MEKVKISKDGASIDFMQSDKVPVSPKKFRQGPELEGFYRFIFENDLRKEALNVIDRLFLARKAMKLKKPLEVLRKQIAMKTAEIEESPAPVKAKAPKANPKTSTKVKAAAPKKTPAKKAPAKKSPAKKAPAAKKKKK